MLLALLPFSAWATITITTQPTISDAVDYNGTAQSAITAAAVAQSTNATTIYYAVTSSSTAPAEGAEVWKTNFADAKATDAGTYYVYVKVTADEEETLRQYVGTFTINKVNPTATAPTAVVDVLTYNGKVQTLFNAGSTTDGTIQYGLSADGPFNEDLPTGKNADTYNLYYKVIGDKNHKDKVFGPVEKVIGQKAFNTTDFTLSREVASVYYNGAKQEPSYVLKFKVDGADDETLAVNEAYTQAYSADPIGVHAYTVSISAKAASNFSGTLTTDNLNTLSTGCGTWTINQKPITVMAKPQSKAYDGNNNLPSTAAGTAYDIIGVVGNENVGTPTLTVAGSGVGPQAITPSALNGDAGVLANYNPTYVPSTLTINKIALTISVDQTNAVTKRNKGENAPSLANLQAALLLNATAYAANEQPTIVTTEEDDIKAAITMAIADNTLGAATTKAGTFAITLTETDAPVLNNYTITLENGTFTVYGGQVTITTLPKSRNYIGSDFDWTRATKGADYIVSGLTGNDQIEGIILSCDTGDGNVGEYDINATWTSAPEWYQVVVVKGKYSIEPQVIEITVKDQTLLDGQALDQTAYEIKSGEKKSTDKWDEIFKLDYQDAGWAEDGKAKATAAGVHAGGIVVSLLPGVTNYELAAGQGAGKLTILDQNETLYLDRADDLATRIHAAAEYCKAAELNTYNVTFATRDLKAETWQAMAFPFDLTVAEFNNKIYTATGAYAVVNILGDPKDGKPVFKLWMREIPANTPFLFKIYNGKTGETLNNFDLVKLTFNGVKIVEGEAKSEDVDGNKFYGIYAPTVVNGDGKTWLFNHNKGTFQKYTGTSRTLAPLTGYLKTANDIDAFARIFVEDFDGTVTAISGINVDAKTVNAEGVYNLNGMKMKDAPTQKGVYIVNGKKVVIK